MFHAAKFLCPALACLVTATTASADGTQAPAPTPVVVAPLHDWTGPYAGLSLSMNSGDFGNDTNFPGDGTGNLSGTGYGLLLGYNVQNGKWIYGAELAFSGADISGSDDCVNASFECGAKIDRFASLRGRLGYAVGPQTMVFGLAGFAAADVHAYTDDSGVVGNNGETKRANGYVFGLGLEHMVSERVSLRGAVVHHAFDKNDYMTDIPYADVDADFTSFEFGVTMHF
ncbi:outer membrane protein [Primorskyibacter sp. 2E107]|uniref:outer membrane protein n=1 Tax=Primorskyibacter sp. 2E107 TaxID=3403458 RepID=UPI003AF67E3B